MLTVVLRTRSARCHRTILTEQRHEVDTATAVDISTCGFRGFT